MRKIIFVLFTCFILLQSCSAFGTAVPSPTSKPTLTPTVTVTSTSTVTPTITSSPTIVKIPTYDYNATSTPPAYLYVSPTPFPGVPTATPIASQTPWSSGEGFEWVKISESKIYWGICKPNKLKVSAQVSEPEDVYSVVLFVRFRRLKAQIFTEWNKGTGMEPVGDDGLWAQTMYANSIEGHEAYRRGWVWFQLVATGEKNIEVGRTRIYMDTIQLEPCMCMTPPCIP